MCSTWKPLCDLIVEPPIGEFGYDDFARATDLIKAGEAVTRAALPQIRQWFVVDAPAETTAFSGASAVKPAAPALAKKPASNSASLPPTAHVPRWGPADRMPNAK